VAKLICAGLHDPDICRSAPHHSLRLRLRRLSAPGCFARGFGRYRSAPARSRSTASRVRPRSTGWFTGSRSHRFVCSCLAALDCLVRPGSTLRYGCRDATVPAGVPPCSTTSHGRTPFTGAYGSRRCSRTPPRSEPCHGLCGDTSRASFPSGVAPQAPPQGGR